MSSIQERLQLKRVPLDTWNIREQLCLASAVVRSGDQNWMSVSRALKTVGEPSRPPDWYSQKSCAAQYGALLENVETPKRKKRSSEGAVETPQESILKKLTQERIVEIQKTIAEMNNQYDQVKNEITEVRNTSTSEERLREIWTDIETAKRAKEREDARVAAAMKEREERRARAERAWRPPSAPALPSTPVPPSSPLLTSLLKSSPVVTTPQHIPHPATVVDTMSPSVAAPTLSLLLEATPALESKYAAIEHIKSQLVQIERQLTANTTPPPVAPTVDIDDIEIKAEDVYAFRDIDIHIPPVTHIHKSNSRTPDKNQEKREEQEAAAVPSEAPLPMEIDTAIEETPAPVDDDKQTEEEDVIIEDNNLAEDTITEEPEVPPTVTPVTVPEPKVPEEEQLNLAFPDVKFPTTEIKFIQPDEQKTKEDAREPEVTVDKAQLEEEVVDVVQEETVPEPVVEKSEEPLPPKLEPEVTFPEPEVQLEPDTPPTAAHTESTQEIVETPEHLKQEVELQQVTPKEEPLPAPETEESSQDEAAPEPEVVVKAEVAEGGPEVIDEGDEGRRDEDAEDSIPLKQMIERDEATRPELSHADTDDDTPMELVREEEKDGKKKRDYSRKKKPDSRTCSGSESAAEASAPDSPGASDAERVHRQWKKSVMLVYSRLCAHKYASLFLRPISDEEAPGYSAVVKRPMDMTAIRRNIENGVIRTTPEFQRDVLLMLSNALLYNSSEHSVYTMAKEMHEEAANQLGILLAAQAHAGLCAPPPRRKRRRPDSPRTYKRSQ